jgi:uncharacterized protein
LHGLLDIESFDMLTLNPAIGASWEGYAIEQILCHKNDNIRPFFYRTHTGAEIDLVLVKTGKPVASVEIKYSNAPKVGKGFNIGLIDLETTQNFVITPNSDTYPIRNATVCSLKVLIEQFLTQL